MYLENPKCKGGPHLKNTYDDYFDEYANSLRPAVGFEQFCNMSGQFTFFVANGVPTTEVFICTLAVFGTRFIRDEPLKSTIEL